MSSVADGFLWAPESTFTRVVGVPRSTYHTWGSERLVMPPESGGFTKLHVVEAAICKEARRELSVNATRSGMDRVREDALHASSIASVTPKKSRRSTLS